MNKPLKRRPQRKCVGCGVIKDKNELIRVVRTPEKVIDDSMEILCPDSRIEIDMRGKLSGRGAYICKNIDCLTKAAKSKRLERSLQCPVSEEIYVSLRQKLAANLTPPSQS